MNRLNRPEFLWPAAVVALLLSGMVLTFSVLYLARSDGGAQVIDRYYRAAVAWDSVAEARSGLERAGLAVDIAIGPDSGGLREVTVRVADSTGVHAAGLALRIEVFSPSLSQAVASADLVDAGSEYRASLRLGDPGLWDFELTGQLDGKPFGTRIRKEIYR